VNAIGLEARVRIGEWRLVIDLETVVRASSDAWHVEGEDAIAAGRHGKRAFTANDTEYELDPGFGIRSPDRELHTIGVEMGTKCRR
jgi:hypothetical protein